MKDINKFKPITKFLMTIGELPSSYLISMSYQEQLIWFCNFIQNEVIPTLNNNSEAIEELQELFTELQNYINDYINTAIDELNETVENHTEDINSLEETVESHTEDINNLEETVESHTEDIDNLEETINYLSSLIIQAFEEITATGTSLTLNNTIEADMQIDLKGNTVQDGTPSPSSPVNINIVTGNNSIKVIGKNLYDKTQFIWTSSTITYKSIYVGTGTYTMSSPNMPSNTTRNLFFLANQVSTGAASGTNGVDLGVSRTITSTDGYITIAGRTSSTGNTNNPSDYDFMIEKSSQATTYEAYKSQTYPINLDSIELCKIDSYYDEIYKNENKWYIKRQIGKLTLNGTENGSLVSSNDNGYLFKIDQPTLPLENYSVNYVSKYTLPNSTANSTNATVGSYIYNNTYRLRVPSDIATTYEEFQTWLASSNEIIYYLLSSPVVEEITNQDLIDQLEGLNEAYSYNPQTNINQTNQNVGFTITATALAKNI